MLTDIDFASRQSMWDLAEAFTKLLHVLLRQHAEYRWLELLVGIGEKCP
jgi:hypothetical protein